MGFTTIVLAQTTTTNFMQQIEQMLSQTLLGVPLYLWIIGILVIALIIGGGGRSRLLAKIRRY